MDVKLTIILALEVWNFENGFSVQIFQICSLRRFGNFTFLCETCERRISFDEVFQDGKFQLIQKAFFFNEKLLFTRMAWL